MAVPETNAGEHEADRVHPETQHELFRYGPWLWALPRNGEHFRRCSFCGSIHPDDLAAEAGWRADWADRKYGWPHKFYVEIANRSPGREYVIGMTAGSAKLGAKGWVEIPKLTAKQREAMARDGYDANLYTSVLFGTRATHFAKFYTIHLNDPKISPEVREIIHQRSGLVLDFDTHQRVRWHPYNEQ